MKKNIIKILSILFIISILIPRFVFAQKQEDTRWTKVNDYIYIDKNSITKNKKLASGWFKIYDSPEYRLDNINGKKVHYKIEKYDIQCEKEILVSFSQAKYYDKNNNLLDEYIATQDYACIYPCMINDKIFVNELCKTK